MTDNTAASESFREFQRSFSYGSRTDLNFKFLSHLSEEEAGRFFQDLLWKLGDALNDGNYNRIIDYVRNWQRKAYSGATNWTYAEGPFVRLSKPASEASIALLTSSGHFVKGDDPEPFGIENMTQGEAQTRIDDFLKTKPVLSSIPVSTRGEDLIVRHPGYDIRGAEADPNVAFPLQRLRELQQEGVIGDLGSHAYSFIGACAQLRLLNETGPEWVNTLREEAIDAVLLVPV